MVQISYLSLSGPVDLSYFGCNVPCSIKRKTMQSLEKEEDDVLSKTLQMKLSAISDSELKAL